MNPHDDKVLSKYLKVRTAFWSIIEVLWILRFDSCDVFVCIQIPNFSVFAQHNSKCRRTQLANARDLLLFRYWEQVLGKGFQIFI